MPKSPPTSPGAPAMALDGELASVDELLGAIRQLLTPVGASASSPQADHALAPAAVSKPSEHPQKGGAEKAIDKDFRPSVQGAQARALWALASTQEGILKNQNADLPPGVALDFDDVINLDCPIEDEFPRPQAPAFASPMLETAMEVPQGQRAPDQPSTSAQPSLHPQEEGAQLLSSFMRTVQQLQHQNDPSLPELKTIENFLAQVLRQPLASLVESNQPLVWQLVQDVMDKVVAQLAPALMQAWIQQHLTTLMQQRIDAMLKHMLAQASPGTK